MYIKIYAKLEIYFKYKLFSYLMNVKINIKDCNCSPALITKKEISEVEFKKKNMLYAPPTKDKEKKTFQTNTVSKNNPKNSNINSTHQYNRNV